MDYPNLIELSLPKIGKLYRIKQNLNTTSIGVLLLTNVSYARSSSEPGRAHITIKFLAALNGVEAQVYTKHFSAYENWYDFLELATL